MLFDRGNHCILPSPPARPTDSMAAPLSASLCYIISASCSLDLQKLQNLLVGLACANGELILFWGDLLKSNHAEVLRVA